MALSSEDLKELEEVKEEIEQMRVLLNELIVSEEYNIVNSKVVESSQYLDRLIMRYLTSNKNVEK